MTNLFIATPAYGEVFYSVYVRSLYRLQQALNERGHRSQYTSLSFSDIAESRNALLTHWFDRSDATHILFVDADMGYDPELILDMVVFDQPVVGVAAPQRKLDLERLAQLAGEGVPAKRAIAGAQEFAVKLPGIGSRDGFKRVEACGAGILLIRRDCIETMLGKLPELSDETAPHTSPLGAGLARMILAFDPIRLEQARFSEDYAFCYRWRRRCGGEIWINVEHEVTHIGLHKFRGRYSDRLPEEAAAPDDAEAASVATLSTPAPGAKPNVLTGRLPLATRGKSGRR